MMTMPYYVSPERIMQDKAEYARKGIARGKSIIAMECENGILLVAENPSRSLNKISEIYDRIAFAGAGKYSEYESLRKAGIKHADIKGYAYGREDVTAKSLANAYSQTVGDIFSQAVKPLEVEILLAQINDEGDDEIYRISFDGTLSDEDEFAAIGGRSDEIKNFLKDRYSKGISLVNALKLSSEAIREVSNCEVIVDNLEAAFLDRNRKNRRFRRVTCDELKKLQKE
jgi:proteasome alpha subunit